LVPARLRPTAPIAADAVLVGDPGRALALAQELLTTPKMSNHARGLWGYHGVTPAGSELTVQATGMGGPSAALVLGDLADLDVRRAVRVGTCGALVPGLSPGELLLVEEAHAWSEPGGGAGETIGPDPALTEVLREQLGGSCRGGSVASLATLHRHHPDPAALRADAADMQTAALFARGRELGIAIAAVLIVDEAADGRQTDDEGIAGSAVVAGVAAAAALSTAAAESNPQVKG
jgi:uridine phosphorylase